MKNPVLHTSPKGPEHCRPL